MVNLNIDNLEAYLNVNKAKLISKGISSVKARVVNLQTLNPNITHESICNAFIEEFFRTYNSECKIETFIEDELLKINDINDNYNHLKDWNWRYGETPDFQHNLEHRFDWGIMDIHMNSKEGLITECKIYSDCLDVQLVDSVSESLIGMTYDKNGISAACIKAKDRLKDYDEYINELHAWLITAI